MYLAQPYSHEDEAVQHHRFEIASYVCARLFIKGYTMFAPIVHWHEVAVKHKLPGDYATWKKYNHAMLDQADSIVVLAISGWTSSRGLTGEVIHASRRSTPAYIIREWVRPELAMTTTSELIKEISRGEDSTEPGLGHIDIDGNDYG